MQSRSGRVSQNRTGGFIGRDAYGRDGDRDTGRMDVAVWRSDEESEEEENAHAKHARE